MEYVLQAFTWVTPKPTPRQLIVITKEDFYSKQRQTLSHLTNIINYIRPLNGKRKAAGTQLAYALEMFSTIKRYKNVDLYDTPEGKSLMRHLRIQQNFETNPAPVRSFQEIKEMFKAASDDARQYQLMLIAFMTAARIGSFQHLQNGGKVKGGWKVTWTDHKTFETRGQVDVVIPTKAIPAEIKEHLENTPKNTFFCSATEQEELEKTLQDVFDNRTYTIRRSALQHMRDNLEMKPAEIILISLHQDSKSLERYLTTPAFFE